MEKNIGNALTIPNKMEHKLYTNKKDMKLFKDKRVFNLIAHQTAYKKSCSFIFVTFWFFFQLCFAKKRR